MDLNNSQDYFTIKYASLMTYLNYLFFYPIIQRVQTAIHVRTGHPLSITRMPPNNMTMVRAEVKGVHTMYLVCRVYNSYWFYSTRFPSSRLASPLIPSFIFRYVHIKSRAGPVTEISVASHCRLKFSPYEHFASLGHRDETFLTNYLLLSLLTV